MNSVSGGVVSVGFSEWFVLNGNDGDDGMSRAGNGLDLNRHWTDSVLV